MSYKRHMHAIMQLHTENMICSTESVSNAEPLGLSHFWNKVGACYKMSTFKGLGQSHRMHMCQQMKCGTQHNCLLKAQCNGIVTAIDPNLSCDGVRARSNER